MQQVEKASVPRFSLLIRIENFIRKVFKVMLAVGGVLYMIMMFATTYHIIGRYGFEKPLLGLVEISGFLLSVALFLSFSYIMVAGENVGVGTIVDNLPKRVQVILDSITHLIALVVTVLACWATLQYGFYMISSGLTTTVVSVPFYPFIIFMGIGWGLLAIAIVIREIHFIAKVVEK